MNNIEYLERISVFFLSYLCLFRVEAWKKNECDERENDVIFRKYHQHETH